jgi:hypothetical protein
VLKVIYRACDLVESVNGSKVRPLNLNKKEIIKISSASLSDCISDIEHEVYIIGDRISEETELFLKNTFNPIHFFNSIEELGSGGSLLKSSEIASSFKDDDLIFFAEDDYLYDKNSFSKKLLDFVNFANKNFEFDWFIHPTDYPDQYTRSINRSYIFQTETGYWREVSSTTGTFLCLGKSYNKFKQYFDECFISNDKDGNLSKIFPKQALCFSPLPGIGTHLHVGTYSNYIDWNSLISKYTK